MSYRFEWDDDKARSNQSKHGIRFDEASTVFDDSLALIFDDEVNSINERREIFPKNSIALGLFHRTAERKDSHHQRAFANKERTEGL